MPPSVVSDPLRVISRGSGYNAMRPLLRCQRQQLVERAPFFEGARTLLIIHLEKNGISRKRGKSLGTRAGRDPNVGANPAQCSVYVGKLNHVLPRNT
jgi:hypothetical protein